MLKRVLAGLAVAVVMAGAAVAGPDEDAIAAYRRGDYGTALRLLQPLAYQGVAAAQNSLGWMYQFGQGLPQDDAQAANWYRKAADHGDFGAQYILGSWYQAGQLVPRDYAEAAKWFRKAADQGVALARLAQFNLGIMYAKGEGVPQDYVSAHMWFNLAAAQGEEGAGKNRDIIATKMTPDQIAEAQRLAREWKPKTQP